MKQRILVRAMEETERESKERMDSQRGQGETKDFGKSYGGDRERESKERMDSQRGQGETKHFGKSYGGDRERE